MTRKRFIKLLMAQGYSRNEADCLAWQAMANAYSYEEAYAIVNIKTIVIPKLTTEQIQDIVQQINKAAWRICEAVCDGVTAFCKAFSARMAAE